MLKSILFLITSLIFAGCSADKSSSSPPTPQTTQIPAGKISESHDPTPVPVDLVNPDKEIVWSDLELTLDSHTDRNLPLGESVMILAKARADSNDPETVQPTWSVTPSNKASIDAKGNLVSKEQGLVVVKATVNGLSTSTSILVTPAIPKNFQITTQNPAALYRVGDTVNLIAIVGFSDNHEESVKPVWTVSSDKVEFLSRDSIKLREKGNLEIMAIFSGMTQKLTLTVAEAGIDSVLLSLARTDVKLQAGRDIPLKASAQMSDGTLNEISEAKWSYEGANATLDSRGIFKASRPGKYSVKASVNNLTAILELNITDAGLVSLLFNKPQDIKVEESTQLKVKGHFSDGETRDIQAIRYELITASNAELTEGGKFVAHESKTFRVRATAEGNIVLEFDIDVKKMTATSLKITSPRLTLDLKEQVQLEATLYGRDTFKKVNPGNINWSVKGPSQVLSLSPDGTVQALAPGKAQIVARYSGSIAEDIASEPLTIEVKANEESTLQIKGPQTYIVGKTFTLTTSLNQGDTSTEVQAILSILEQNTDLKQTSAGVFLATKSGRAVILAKHDGLEVTREIIIEAPSPEIIGVQYWVHKKINGKLTFNTPWDEQPGDDIKHNEVGIPPYALTCASEAKEALIQHFNSSVEKQLFADLLSKGVPSALSILVTTVENDADNGQTPDLARLDRQAYFWRWHWKNQIRESETGSVKTVYPKPSLALTRFAEGEWLYEVIASPTKCTLPSRSEMIRYLEYAKTRAPFKIQGKY
ncbi:MAG: hypothetical protein EOP10_00050 [Proteobacteria bacterium]|nr:MAG: hypothetical protein EOP10_00050 [Pseudomonadota bacterium]